MVTGVASSDAGIPCTVSSLKGRTLQSSGDASSVESCSDVVRVGVKNVFGSKG